MSEGNCWTNTSSGLQYSCSGLFSYCCTDYDSDGGVSSYCCVNNIMYSLFWVSIGFLLLMFLILILCSSNFIREKKRSRSTTTASEIRGSMTPAASMAGISIISEDKPPSFSSLADIHSVYSTEQLPKYNQIRY